MIPKNIHSIWFQGWDSLPAKYVPNVESVAYFNPDWKYFKWDDTSIRGVLASLGPSYVQKYDSFKLLHQKVDYGRYAVLYVYGGVSVDIDAKALKGFDTLPQLGSSDFMVSVNSTNGFVTNATILVSEKNPVMKELLDSVSSDCSSSLNDFSCVQNTTGPKAFNKFVDSHKEITILPNVYFEPCSGRNKYCVIPPETILDHRHDWSWIHPSLKGFMDVFYEIKQYWMVVVFFLLVLIFLILANKKS